MNEEKFKIKIIDLYKEIWTISVSGVAKKYHLHYPKLLKKCKEYQIPIPHSGYWAQLSNGKNVKQVPLPILGDKIIELDYALDKKIKKDIKIQNSKILKDNVDSKGNMNDSIESANYEISSEVLIFLNQEEKQKVTETINRIPELKNKKTHKILRSYKPVKKDQSKYERNKKRDFFDEVSKDSLKRISSFLNCIYYAVEELGGQVNSLDSITIRSFDVNISIKEGQDNIPHKLTKQEALELIKYKDSKKNGGYAFKPNIRKYDKQYNGRITLKISYDKWVFRDKKYSKIEEDIPNIIIALIEESENQKKIFEQREKERLLRKKEEEERQRKDEIKKQENIKVKKLLNIINDFETATKIRDFIDALMLKDELTNEEKEWIDWMQKKADWFDPLVSYEDEIYGKREHEKDDKEKNVFENTNYWKWNF